jgi:hypothetical protein
LPKYGCSLKVKSETRDDLQKLNVENAMLVADTFLDWAFENKIPISSNCIMANSDHASTSNLKNSWILLSKT